MARIVLPETRCTVHIQMERSRLNLVGARNVGMILDGEAQARLRDIVKLAEHAGVTTDKHQDWQGNRWLVQVKRCAVSNERRSFDPFTSLDDAWLLPVPDFTSGVPWTRFVRIFFKKNLIAWVTLVPAQDLAEARTRAYAAAHDISLET